MDSPRVENDNGAAKLEPNEKERATSSSFGRVTEKRGSRFPSNSTGYKLWEFESLADFIEYRKLDAKNRSVQRRPMDLCSNSSARRFDPETAKRRSEVCERRCEAASELPRQGSRSCEGTDVKNDLGTASTVEQDTKVDEALDVKAELDTVLSVHQYARVHEAVYSEPEVHAAAIIVQDTRVDGSVSPEAELETASWGEAVDSKDRKNLEHTQASSIVREGDVLSAREQDSTTEEASSSDEHMVEPSTGRQEIRGPVAETEDKPKKRKEVTMEKSEDVCKTPEKLGEALDWINQIVEQRERWMQEAKSSSSEGPSEKPTSIQDRIRSLQDRLSAARTGWLSGREALGQKGDAQGQPNTTYDGHTRKSAELREALDELEYTGVGVFIVSLPFPPGRYEIKFIVDGTWRVDTGRPIIYVAGYENNVVTISEQFTLGQRR